jgi:hypothetical protein
VTVDPTPDRVPLTQQDIETLGRYNAERWRGLVHTKDYDERMAALQARFDRPEATRS